jgi:hypothetical protein
MAQRRRPQDDYVELDDEYDLPDRGISLVNPFTSRLSPRSIPHSTLPRYISPITTAQILSESHRLKPSQDGGRGLENLRRVKAEPSSVGWSDEEH